MSNLICKIHSITIYGLQTFYENVLDMEACHLVSTDALQFPVYIIRKSSALFLSCKCNVNGHLLHALFSISLVRWHGHSLSHNFPTEVQIHELLLNIHTETFKTSWAAIYDVLNII